MKESELIKSALRFSLFVVLIVAGVFMVYFMWTEIKNYKSPPCKDYRTVTSIDYQTNFWGTVFFTHWSDGSIDTEKGDTYYKIGDKECDQY